MVELLIENKGVIYEPAVLEGITLAMERKQAGKLSFSVVKDGALDFTEGNPVSFKYGGRKMFYGFVFSKKRDKSGVIDVTCYDQMRYLKNKDTYEYSNKTASELVKMIAEDFQLKTGTIEDTGWKIGHRREDNRSLLDIILNALDETLMGSGRLYVLHDDFGALSLRDVESMKLDVVIDGGTAEDFSYESSIDGATYDKIKLSYENEGTGKRDVYVAQDGANIGRWGVLQLFEELKDPAQGAARAAALLSLHNRKTRSLQIKGAFGDARVRAGSALVVRLNLGDIIVGNYMMAEKVKHVFENGSHAMDLTMRGGEFVG